MNKLYGVIDIGSNSVRLLLSDGKNTLYKVNTITKLAEGLGDALMLKKEAIKRTAKAVYFYYKKAIKDGATVVWAFGTASLRIAKNKDEFIYYMQSLCPLKVEIISGEKEANLGLIGATNFNDGGIIDIGGASTEIALLKDKKTVYYKSVNFGAVNTYNFCKDNINVLENFTNSKIVEYGKIIKTNYYAIGGTATSIASILIGKKEYNSNLVNGYKLNFSDVIKIKDLLYSKSVKERQKIVGLQKKRAEVIFSGTYILYKIMKEFNLNSVTISENDNLEGYLMEKLCQK